MGFSFPIEFIVPGNAYSLTAGDKTLREWKRRIKQSCQLVLPSDYRPYEGRIAATIYYFLDEQMRGDVDNIVKPVLDALSSCAYVDDKQVDRVVVQRFEGGNIFAFTSPSQTLAKAVTDPKPLVYVRLSNNPFEDLK